MCVGTEGFKIKKVDGTCMMVCFMHVDEFYTCILGYQLIEFRQLMVCILLNYWDRSLRENSHFGLTASKERHI